MYCSDHFIRSPIPFDYFFFSIHNWLVIIDIHNRNVDYHESFPGIIPSFDSLLPTLSPPSFLLSILSYLDGFPPSLADILRIWTSLISLSSGEINRRIRRGGSPIIENEDESRIMRRYLEKEEGNDLTFNLITDNCSILREISINCRGKNELSE